jgi:membrane-bound lytic murein transglycosylase B
VARPARPARRSGFGIVLVALLGMAAVVALVRISALGDRSEQSSRGDGLVAADVERGTPASQPAPLPTGLDVAAWSAETAERSGVPRRALRAYATAELAQRVANPECRLSWVTLAGIGRVESHHGGLGSAELDADGVARPRIVGVALDGSSGVREIRDTDGGRLDGDTTYDRAVGPMQFLPTTWERFGADGNGDGDRDPHQLDDAALAAAGYLCVDGRDTASGTGWWAGVLTYNRSVSYARLVWAATERYASAAGTAAGP